MRKKKRPEPVLCRGPSSTIGFSYPGKQQAGQVLQAKLLGVPNAADVFDSPIRALCVAQERIPLCGAMTIVGDWIKVKPPAGIKPAAWSNVLLWHAKNLGIEPVQIGGPLPEICGDSLDLLEALSRLNTELSVARGKGKKIFGRPPYGYVVKEGNMAIDPVRVPAVRRIFEMARKGSTWTGIINSMCSDFQFVGKSRQYWDRTKVLRIIKHARLYCLGEKTDGGSAVSDPSLAILPSDWVDTHVAKRTGEVR
jgi:hypothetical protein